MKQFATAKTALLILRLAVGVIFITHGGIRTWAGTVPNFGEFLDGFGFPLGHVIAWDLPFLNSRGESH